MKGSANILGGELSVNIKSVRSDKYFVRPWNECDTSNDLTMVLGNNEYLHICGNNDWAFLALELLTPIKDEAKKIMELVKDRKSQTPKLRAVMLGKNDKRIMDVYFGGKGKCDRIFGLPVLTTEHLNEVSFLIEDTHELPFD